VLFVIELDHPNIAVGRQSLDEVPSNRHISLLMLQRLTRQQRHKLRDSNKNSLTPACPPPPRRSIWSLLRQELMSPIVSGFSMSLHGTIVFR
jgi:hypothetical protein